MSEQFVAIPVTTSLLVDSNLSGLQGTRAVTFMRRRFRQVRQPGLLMGAQTQRRGLLVQAASY